MKKSMGYTQYVYNSFTDEISHIFIGECRDDVLVKALIFARDQKGPTNVSSIQGGLKMTPQTQVVRVVESKYEHEHAAVDCD